MPQRSLEGTWEEIQAQAEALKGHRLRVIVLDAEDDLQEEESLAQRLGDRVGILDLDSAPDARDIEDVFGDIVAEKHDRRSTGNDSV